MEPETTREQKHTGKGKNLGLLFHECARIFGDKPALVYRDPARCVTFRELDIASDTVAKSLMASGIAPGSKAAIWVANIPEWLIVLLGCAKAGVPLVLLNTRFRAHDLEYTLVQADVEVLFMSAGTGLSPEFPDILREICPELNVSAPGFLASPQLPHLKMVIYLGNDEQTGMLTWQQFLSCGCHISGQELLEREISVTPDTAVGIFLTSGTTGQSKSALWPHDAFIGNLNYISSQIGFVPDDITCTPLPFFHVYGSAVLLGSLLTGCTVAPLVRFDAQEFLRTIETFRATQVFGTPTMFVAALDEISRNRYDTSSLRGGNMGGSVAPPALVRAVIEKMGATGFGALYGMTEILLFACASPQYSPEQRIQSIGRPAPEIRAMIINPANGAEIPSGEQGELMVKTPWMMSGYYKNPQATASLITAEGFVHTGDLGYVDNDGFYYITGRSKDLIIRGGENISPAEIEEFLLTHPAVLEAQVVGIPSEYYGEEPVGFIRLKAGLTVTALELKQFCRRNIAHYKVPVTFFFVGQYPLTASGKVQKFRLREMAAEIMSVEK